MHRLSALILAVLSSATLAADGTRTPVAAYKSHASFALVVCGFAVSGARARAESAALGAPASSPASESPEDCVRAREEESKPLLRAASASLKGQPRKSALAGYHAAFVSTLRGLLPASGEMVFQYNARQAALKDKLAAAEAMLTAEGVE